MGTVIGSGIFITANFMWVNYPSAPSKHFQVVCCGILGGRPGYLGTLWDSCSLWGSFLGRLGNMGVAHCDGWGGLLFSTLAMGLPRACGKAAQAGRHLHLHQRGNRGGSSISLHNIQSFVAQPVQPGKNQSKKITNDHQWSKMQPGGSGACSSSVSCCPSLPLLSS